MQKKNEYNKYIYNERMFFMQGIRGAITVENDNHDEIINAVKNY